MAASIDTEGTITAVPSTSGWEIPKGCHLLDARREWDYDRFDTVFIGFV